MKKLIALCVISLSFIGLNGCTYWGDKKAHKPMPAEEMDAIIRDAKQTEQGRHTQPAPIFKKVFTEPTAQ